MSTEVWITLITAVVAPVAARIAAHYFPIAEDTKKNEQG